MKLFKTFTYILAIVLFFTVPMYIYFGFGALMGLLCPILFFFQTKDVQQLLNDSWDQFYRDAMDGKFGEEFIADLAMNTEEWRKAHLQKGFVILYLMTAAMFVFLWPVAGVGVIQNEE